MLLFFSNQLLKKNITYCLLLGNFIQLQWQPHIWYFHKIDLQLLFPELPSALTLYLNVLLKPNPSITELYGASRYCKPKTKPEFCKFR